MGEVLRLRQKMLLLLGACLLAVSLASAGCTAAKGLQSKRQEPLPTTNIAPLGSRILVVSPHPDDEGLATAGLLQQAVKGHVDVRVVVVTAGDASAGAVRSFSRAGPASPEEFRMMGNARCQETRDALAALGVPRNDVIFLTYSDGSVNSLWDVNWDYARPHTGRAGADRSPYSFSYQKNAPYCGANLAKNLTAIVKDYKPTSIVYPDEADQHHDHWAVNAFVQYVVLSSGYDGAEYTYLVHRNDFPSPHAYEPQGYLEPPHSLRNVDNGWSSLPLSRRQQDNKARALKDYVVPRSIKKSFIDSFVRRNELLRREAEERAMHIGNARPDFTRKSMPYVVERDPSNDSFPSTAGKGGELNRVSFCMGDSQAYLALSTGGRVRADLDYAFHLRLFKGHRVDRYDIEVRDKEARCGAFASNSVALRGRIPVHVKVNRLWITLPASAFTGRDALMLSVDSMNGTSTLDRTVWHRLYL